MKNEINSEMEKNKMNILVTIDKNYLPPLEVMLVSMGESNKDDLLDIYVAHSNLTESDLKPLYDKTACFENMHIHSLRVPDKYFADTPVIERLPKESFYRLIAFEILPQEVDRCIYIDPDTYILRSLRPLYEMDMGDCFIAAGSHTYSYIEKINHVRLKMGKHSKYINSGIMLMDLEKMRLHTSVEEIMEYLEANIQKLYLGDQDAMNGLFWEYTMDLDIKLYNMDEKTLKRYKIHADWAKENTVIVHYNGKYKPWLEGYKGELDVFYPPVENKGPAPKGKLKAKLKAYKNIIKLNKQQKIVISIFALFWALCIACYIGFSGSINTMLQTVLDENRDLFIKQLHTSCHGFEAAIFVLIRAIQTVVKVVPAEPLEIGSGYAFGTFGGLALCLLGNILGSIFILAMTKKFGRRIVDIFVPSSKIDEMQIFKNPSKIYTLLFILYIIPGTPKDGFTYMVGLTNIDFVKFMILTSIARIPSIITSTYVGNAIGDKNYLLSILVFIATFLLGVGGSILYSRKFSSKEEEKFKEREEKRKVLEEAKRKK